MSEENKSNYVILTDEEGNEKEFEHIDTLEDNGTVYMAFIPAELNLEESLRLYNLFMSRLEALYDAPEDDEE